MNLRELLAARWEELGITSEHEFARRVRAAGYRFTSQNLNQLRAELGVTRMEFPKVRTIQALADGLEVSAGTVVLAIGETLGLDMSELRVDDTTLRMVSLTQDLTDWQRTGLVRALREMVNSYGSASRDGHPLGNRTDGHPQRSTGLSRELSDRPRHPTR
jgi:hypothetical protein